MSTVQCYCRAVFRAETRLEGQRLLALTACPKCGRADRLAIVGNRIVHEIIAENKEKEKAEQERVRLEAERAYVDWWEGHMKRMGLEGYVPSYNVARSGPTVLELLPDVGPHDFRWLCNKLSNHLSDVRDNCIDNIRMCHDDHGRYSEGYAAQRNLGCCGFSDKRVINKRTGNAYWIGCNYGH